MFRDRTNLYISFRQSYTHHPTYTTGRDRYDLLPEEEQGLIDGNDTAAVEMDLLPPRWLDVSDEVDEELKAIGEKISQLGALQKKNALPGFDDRTKEEREIENLTYDITADLHRLQNTMKRFDAMTNAEANSTPAQMKMAANMKISLATKIQETSTVFRKMQSTYLKSLRSDEPPEPSRVGSPSPYGAATYDPALEDELDVSYSERTLEQQQSLVQSQDVNIQQREKEITKIAQGILEIAEIFKDLQSMVIDQGTLLDRIDYNIETMYTNVKQADSELVTATHYQKRTQKCKVILLLILLVVGMVIILIIKPKRHSSSTPPAPAPPTKTPPLGVSNPDDPSSNAF